MILVWGSGSYASKTFEKEKERRETF